MCVAQFMALAALPGYHVVLDVSRTLHADDRGASHAMDVLSEVMLSGTRGPVRANRTRESSSHLKRSIKKLRTAEVWKSCDMRGNPSEECRLTRLFHHLPAWAPWREYLSGTSQTLQMCPKNFKKPVSRTVNGSESDGDNGEGRMVFRATAFRHCHSGEWTDDLQLIGLSPLSPSD